MSDSALERQAEPQGNLVSRKAVINTLESMCNACDNNCYDLYLLLKESYEVLPSAYSDIEAIRREIDGLLNNYDNRMYDLGVIEALEIIDKHMKGDTE